LLLVVPSRLAAPHRNGPLAVDFDIRPALSSGREIRCCLPLPFTSSGSTPGTAQLQAISNIGSDRRRLLCGSWCWLSSGSSAYPALLYSGPLAAELIVDADR